MITEMIEAIRMMQRASPNIKIHSISLDAKSREHLIFEMMKQDVRNPSPNKDQAARYGGVVSLLGVEIKREEPK